MSISLLSPSAGYKPFRYPWAYEYWLQQQQIHWLPEELPLSEDVADWVNVLTDSEREFLTQIFRFFTQADVDVNDNYMTNYARIFKPTEIRMMLSAFSNMETIHIDAYSLLIETVGMPDSEYTMFMNYSEMRAKHDYLNKFNVDTHEDTLRTLAVYGAFTEGLQLYASFAMLLNFPRFGKMKQMGQVVTWSVRDESLHCDGIIQLFHEYAKESGCLTKSVKDEIVDIAKVVVGLEDGFIDLVFNSAGAITGMTADEIKKYIRYCADWRLMQLGLPVLYNITEHPIPWLQEILNGVEHSNFFEVRSTEYAKGATQGDWSDVWGNTHEVYVPVDHHTDGFI